MTVELLEAPIRNWACPSCNDVDRTQRSDAHTQMHNCKGLHGLLAPLVEVKDFDSKVKANHSLIEREDYCGDKYIPRIGAINTERLDGSNDRTVFAPTAVLQFGSLMNGFGGESAQHAARAGIAAASAKFHNRSYGDRESRRMAELALETQAEMAFGASSKVFARTVLDTLGRGTAVDWDSDTEKVALYGNGVTPDNTVTSDAATMWTASGGSGQWSGADGFEVTGTNYTTGGVAITTQSLAQSSNVVTFSSTSTPTWTTATITAYGCLVYDTTVSVGLCFLSFGSSAQTVSAGTFTIAWNGSGIATFTC